MTAGVQWSVSICRGPGRADGSRSSVVCVCVAAGVGGGGCVCRGQVVCVCRGQMKGTDGVPFQITIFSVKI